MGRYWCGAALAIAVACVACGTVLQADPDPSADGGTDDGGPRDGSNADGSEGGDGGDAFPFAMTFENGSLFGPLGANVAPTMSPVSGAGALFGKTSAVTDRSLLISTVERRFPPQTDAYFSFYAKVLAGAGGVLMRLDGGAGSIVEITASGGGPGIAYVSKINGTLTQLGSGGNAVVERFGVRIATGGTGVATIAVYRDDTFGDLRGPPLATGTLIEGGAATGIVLGNVATGGEADITIDEVRGTVGSFAPPSH